MARSVQRNRYSEEETLALLQVPPKDQWDLQTWALLLTVHKSLKSLLVRIHVETWVQQKDY